MKSKTILLVNPWICDFAAYDLWMFPLGLLNIAPHLFTMNAAVFLLDFLNRYESRPVISQKDSSPTAGFGTGHFHKQEIKKPEAVKNIQRKFFRYGLPPEIIEKKLEKMKPDIILVTSGMTYWYVGIQQTIALLRKYFRKVPIILGGTYATLCPEHARKKTAADCVFTGGNIKEIKDVVSRYLGLRSGPLKRNNVFPAFELLASQKALPVLGSLGCPFDCTYCASGILYPRFLQKNPRHITEQIEYCVRRFKTADFVFYDDALLVNTGQFLKPILRALAEKKLKIRFHTPNGLHARFIDQELAELMYMCNFKTIRLSLESASDFLKEKSNGKVNNAQLEKGVDLLLGAGFSKKEVGIYTMVGFPGQRAADIEQDIDYVHSLGAQVFLSSYSLVNQSREWEALNRTGRINAQTDPLRFSHTAFPLLYGGFNAETMRILRKKAAVRNKT